MCASTISICEELDRRRHLLNLTELFYVTNRFDGDYLLSIMHSTSSTARCRSIVQWNERFYSSTSARCHALGKTAKQVFAPQSGSIVAKQ